MKRRRACKSRIKSTISQSCLPFSMPQQTRYMNQHTRYTIREPQYEYPKVAHHFMTNIAALSVATVGRRHNKNCHNEQKANFHVYWKWARRLNLVQEIIILSVEISYERETKKLSSPYWWVRGLGLLWCFCLLTLSWQRFVYILSRNMKMEYCANEG